ncbi:hypothetical protein NXS19_003178 [Fusarium pseudograminearum]|nr:hypothetical protein FPSE5266_20245 [Fusarium pseudograminearum]UZP35362.1 hypothetical protein NXS19_003178 [Fusarium pseudograminearum]
MQHIRNDLDVSGHNENSGGKDCFRSCDVVGISDSGKRGKLWAREDALRYIACDFWLVDPTRNDENLPENLHKVQT